MRFHACFSAFCNLTGKAKTDPIRPFMSAIGFEGARAPCAPPPVWIRPWLLNNDRQRSRPYNVTTSASWRLAQWRRVRANVTRAVGV